LLNSKQSTWADILSGVPQGNVLGPILFLIFINDLDTAATMVDIIQKFADDTKLGSAVETDSEGENLQAVLNNLTDWASKWGMELNVEN
jgi:ribonucleases P/MRP protein subunit RPP40